MAVGALREGFHVVVFPEATSTNGAQVLPFKRPLFAAAMMVHLHKMVAARESARLLAELRQAMAEIKTLQGLIPICAWCHRVRNDGGLWQQIENYVQTHTDASFSHGICPDCDTHMQDEIVHRSVTGMHS